MDRKRKAPNATPSSSEGGAPKKIKLLNSSHAPAPSVQSEVQRVGLQLVTNLRKGQDKAGRLIASQFLTLPSREELPQYYAFTKLPIAIDDIERKLHNHAYSTITEIESDFKRMVQNAKDYNSTGSEIFEDAERIRKLVYNYMKVHNPAYTNEPGYTSFPTPLPEGAVEPVNHEPIGHGENGRRSNTPARQRRTTTTALPEARDNKNPAAASATPGVPDENESGVEFEGKTFQQAQQIILDELLHYTDDEGLEIYTPFANLPSRKLEDYYKVILHPVSLKGVAKRVRGQHGRNDPTGVSDFKNWDAFAHEVSFIWRNAREYNEDGSEMYLLANDLEEHFKSLLEDAKAKVGGPSHPKLKIAGPKPKVTLNLSQNRPSPAPAPAPAVGSVQTSVSVDSEALARQRQMVAAGVNGRQTEQRQSPAINGRARSTSQVPTIEHPRPVTASSPTDGVKLEQVTTQSPAVSAAIPAALTNGSMKPPAVRPPSSSPYPNGQPASNSYTFTAPSLLPPTPLRSYPLAEALMPTITLATHPQLRLANPFRLAITPHPTLTQQSCTVTLPSSHYFVQILPTISESLTYGRPYKMFVNVNGTRLAQRDTFAAQSESKLRTHAYEGTLAPGVNRIEVEVAAAKENGKEGIDVEKVIVFANLAKA